jgi:hypothetical protein
MKAERTLPPGVELRGATPEQEQVLANLLQFYVYDFSKFLDLTVDSLGKFHYAELPRYWKEPTRFPLSPTAHRRSDHPPRRITPLLPATWSRLLTGERQLS